MNKFLSFVMILFALILVTSMSYAQNNNTITDNNSNNNDMIENGDDANNEVDTDNENGDDANNEVDTDNENGDDVNNIDTVGNDINENTPDDNNSENNTTDDTPEKQDGHWTLGFELPGLGVGLGPAFEDAYGLIMPGQRTRFLFLFGATWDAFGVSWWGIGNDGPQAVTDSDTTSIMFLNPYVRIKAIQIMVGDHNVEEFWLDMVLESETKFRIPLGTGLYQEDTIAGTDPAINERINFFVEMCQTNSYDNFWAYSGFKVKSEFWLDIGGEFATTPSSWFAAGMQIDGIAWVPIVENYLHLRFRTLLEATTEPAGGTSQLAFWLYPELGQGDWKGVRGFSTKYRGTLSFTNTIDIKSRFLVLDEIAWPMALGVGLWYDLGLVRYGGESYSGTPTPVKMSIGSYLEYKIIFFGSLLPLTIHLGATLFNNDNDAGTLRFNPGVYFAFGY